MTTTVLELAISLMLLYLIISGFCSAIQEFIANALRWRSSTLQQALGLLLKDKNVAGKIYGHVLAAGLWSPAWLRKDNPRKPSYIPPDTFARILLDLHQNQQLEADSSAVVKKLLEPVENSFEKHREVVEKWFNDSMERVSGWYKRKAHAWLWLIAVVVCGVLNADTIGFSRLLWNDEALRQSTVAAATTYVKENERPKNTQPDAEVASPSQAIDNLTKARKKLEQSSPIPLGWCSETSCWPFAATPPDDKDDPRRPPQGASAWFLRIVGILITSLAVSQGAPFWFDLLQKAVNLRLSGTKPQAAKPGATNI